MWAWGRFHQILVVTALAASQSLAQTMDVNATLTALRLRNAITGGTLPISDPLFQRMLQSVQAGDNYAAARLATDSKYFAGSVARRLALQMQTPALNSAGIADSDASAFLIAHFVGAGTSPRISTIWSENATYLVVGPNGTPVHAASLNSTQLAQVDWTKMVRTAGQQDANKAYMPVQHIGGYVTLSDRPGDTSFASFGATQGTNLRMIEGIWEISTGLSLMDVASTAATVGQVPRFIPVYDPNFFQGQGQPACISCHGGGMSSLDHGYATVANLFDFNARGLIFNFNPSVNQKKSLGSDPNQRARNQTCNLTRTPTPVCNPESLDVDAEQAWDVSATWLQSGVLSTMGWAGPMKGNGLQSLGYAIGQSWIVYQFLTQRVIAELCPLGNFSALDINRIAAAANPWAEPAGTDDLRTIVALVAIHAGCQ